MTKKVIWSLFDVNTCTVANTFANYDVLSIGLKDISGSNAEPSPSEGVDLDLSSFDNAKQTLDKLPLPDYIFASPPCESWVAVSVGNLHNFTTEKGLNMHWKNKWTPFDFKEKYKQTRENGINTALTTARILQHYKPTFWAIENGRSSLIFDFLQEFTGLTGYRNKCNYYSYGFECLKPSIIYSNSFLILKNQTPKHLTIEICDGVKCKKRQELKKLGKIKRKDYNSRSLVPVELYKDIAKQFKLGGNQTLL